MISPVLAGERVGRKEFGRIKTCVRSKLRLFRIRQSTLVFFLGPGRGTASIGSLLFFKHHSDCCDMSTFLRDRDMRACLMFGGALVLLGAVAFTLVRISRWAN